MYILLINDVMVKHSNTSRNKRGVEELHIYNPGQAPGQADRMLALIRGSTQCRIKGGKRTWAENMQSGISTMPTPLHALPRR